jgi:TonB family protein
VTQDYGQAMTWYHKAADQGDAGGQTGIGWLYENGFGVTQDYSEALTWYLEAADKGDSPAQNNVGWFYEKGRGVTPDYTQAAAWFYRAAEQGNALAEANLGWLYEKGLGVTQDYAKAAALYRKAAEHGNVHARNDLGRLYLHGFGVKQDESEALNWYRKAAEQGSTEAQASIACLNEAERAKASEAAGSPGTVCLPNGIRAPRAIIAPDPEYSTQARKEGIAGTVVLSLVVGPDGDPRDITVARSLGHGLDEQAIAAVKRWKFEPGMKDGKPVAVRLSIEVDFRLQ